MYTYQGEINIESNKDAIVNQSIFIVIFFYDQYIHVDKSSRISEIQSGHM